MLSGNKPALRYTNSIFELEYIPLSTRTSVFVRVEPGSNEIAPSLVVFSIGRKSQRRAVEVNKTYKVEGSEVRFDSKSSKL